MYITKIYERLYIRASLHFAVFQAAYNFTRIYLNNKVY